MDKGLVSDDACGKLLLPVQELAQAAQAGMGWTEQWYPLTDANSGRIRLAVEYAPFVADNGPTSTQQDELGTADGNCHSQDESKSEAGSAGSAAACKPGADYRYGSLCLRIVRASNLPRTVLGGKPDAYVTASYQSFAGESCMRTSAVESDCNPEWHEDLVFRERLEQDRDRTSWVLDAKDSALVQDKHIKIALNDGSSSSLIDGDPCVASTKLFVKDVLAKPGEFHLTMMEGCTLVVKAHFEESKAKPLAAVGSDWLNGVLRKAWQVFGKEIDGKVRLEVNKTLYKLAHPEPDPEGQVKSLPGIKDLLLDRFSLGAEPPFFLELKLLNTRYVLVPCPHLWPHTLVPGPHEFVSGF